MGIKIPIFTWIKAGVCSFISSRILKSSEIEGYMLYTNEFRELQKLHFLAKT
jgi:hypothetical protein